ncbi:MAG: NB-ARC domain-containing protein, partial [Myxococcota bacterium]
METLTLPPQLIGRATECTAVSTLLEPGMVVTLVGPPGVGKTALAQELARRAGGVFCGLRACRHREDVWSALGRALDVPLLGEVAADDLQAALSEARTLIVLDNAEHMVEVLNTEVLPVMLKTLVTLLVTSRRRLGHRDERCFEVQPLDEEAAVALFKRAAWQVRVNTPVESETREAVRAIVRHVDALPLALLLAASRIAIMTPAQMAHRLREGREVLTSLDRAIDLSWRLLTPWEQAAALQCVVFRGGFDVAAA